MSYWKVTEDGGEEIELPSEEDGTLLLTTLSAQFSGASGLKYKCSESGSFRGIRLADGKLHPPNVDIPSTTFHCVFPKADKRKFKSDDGENEFQSKRLDIKSKCSDLIILGLPYKTTEDQVREYFEQYGDLLLVQVKKSLQTGRSKGFGFIRYDKIESQAKVICSRHLIDGRWCEVKIAGAKNDDMNNMSTKIFVGRLTEDINESDLNDYFSQFGQVLDVYIPKPFRGFAFVNFADPYVAHQLCGEDHIIKGVSVHVSRASPRGDSSNKKRDDGRSNGGFNYSNPSRSYQWNSKYHSNDYNYRESGGGGMDYRGSSNRGGPRDNGPPPSNINADLSAITPALLAAAFNQTGLGNLLSSLQGGGSGGPPPELPNQRYSSNNSGSGWNSPSRQQPPWSKRERDPYESKYDHNY